MFVRSSAKLLILLFLACNPVPPQQLGSQGIDPASLYRRDTLEAYLERADRLSNEGAWRTLAERGSDAAFAAWERQALAACGSGVELADARAAVRGLIAGQVEDRWADWLVDRFFRRLPAASLAAFHAAVRAGNLAYLFVTADGRVCLEEATGDPVAPGSRRARRRPGGLAVPGAGGNRTEPRLLAGRRGGVGPRAPGGIAPVAAGRGRSPARPISGRSGTGSSQGA